MIPYGRQDIDQDDIDAVVKVLKSDFLTQGPLVPMFEAKLAKACGSEFAVAVNSATSALHIACLALDLGPGDWLWTSPITFVASSNCALYCGAKVDFIDIDPATYNLSANHLAEKLARAALENKLPKIVIPVHLAGQSCDMEPIYQLSQQYGFRIIEDASHAIGGKYRDAHVGNCKFSDITIFSFHPVKIITSGEGGAALTNDLLLADRMRRFRSHGITSDNNKMIEMPGEEIWNYQQIDLGFNYRMTDIQSALGLSQLNKLDRFVTSRQKIAGRYNEELKNLPIQLPFQIKDSYSSFHLYLIRVKKIIAKKSQKQIYEGLKAKGIDVNLHYIPVYLQPYYQRRGFQAGYCPEAEAYFKEVISIPMYASLSDHHQDVVIDALNKVFN